ncbi:hypothetical protein ACFQ0K_05705 [Nocardioides caeni]|uniref:WD40 repeat domain-containing protein n=1 Tax=Nocardioides caeni TaxID=574700 RepID=A0A4S8N8Z0_9ACTN|nr:WD40 repeat domain-containing protein [Nocardioides caeni]THV12181.1 WD40 repeat domain-containing protein [Nocardioides caeni]
MSGLERVLLALLPTAFVVGVLTPGSALEPADSEVAFSFADVDIRESSGLVARSGLVVTVNDSGDSSRVFTVDPATGETVGTSEWSADAVDIEALAPGADGTDSVLVGDIGDNAAAREEVVVSQVPFARGDLDFEATQWRFAYSDGPHDAETLLVHPVTGRIYVVAKEFIGRIYEAPEELDASGVNELTPLEEPDGRVLGVATDGTFFPDGQHLLLRNYGQAAVYTWPALERLGTFDLPAQPQGEGIAVSESGDILVSSEGEHADVLRVELPADVQAAMAAEPGELSSEFPADDPCPASAMACTVDVSSDDERGWWPWALGGLGGLVGLLLVIVLVRSLRRH